MLNKLVFGDITVAFTPGEWPFSVITTIISVC